jgi:putative DNA primase/helicase
MNFQHRSFERDDVAEFLATHNIRLPDTTPGQHCTTCPQCSADRKRSNQTKKVLGVKIDDRGVTWHCHHCEWSGPQKGSGKQIVATYDYIDEHGELLFQAVRFTPKDFRQRRPVGNGWEWNLQGVRRVIYRLPEVIEAVSAQQTIHIAEGEKDVDRLWGIGLAATCNPMGAGKWRDDYNESFRDADVVIIPDNDQTGEDHAKDVVRNLRGVAGRIRIACVPDFKDVSDWIGAGHTREELDALITDAPVAYNGSDELRVLSGRSPPLQPNDEPEAQDRPRKRANRPNPNNVIITEDSAAVRFVEECGHLLRYCHSTGAWFKWDDNIWRKQETRLAFHWVRLMARELAEHEEPSTRAKVCKTSFASGVERFAQSDPEVAVTVDFWDRDEWLLGTPSGTVDLRTGALSPGKQADGITKATSVAPANTGCPLWLKFLNETTGNDAALIRFLQQWLGYCLTGSIREHAFIFVYGDGGNGKSVFLETVTSILGDYATTAAMETFTASHADRHPTDLAMLRGARLVTASETEEGRAWAEAKIKAMTGGDRVAARFMRQDFFQYNPQFKLTVIGNYRPVLRNVDDAMRRRINLIPFVRKPVEPDKKLKDKLTAEAPGILQWIIDGCLDWQENGLIRPEVVQAATDAYFSDQDLFTQWVEECCDVRMGSEDVWDRSADLFESWAEFCEKIGEEPGSSKSFASRLGRKGFEAGRFNRNTTRGFRFIRVKAAPLGFGSTD